MVRSLRLVTTDSDDAQTSANSASATASTAQTAADAAQTDADAAQSTADTAASDLTAHKALAATEGALGHVKKMAAEADLSVTISGTADATYSANEVTLINDLKAAVNSIESKINAMLAEERTKGQRTT